MIDIGSNTIRLSVFNTANDELYNLFNEKATVGLASYRENKVLTEEGIQRLIEVLREFKYVIDNFDDIEAYYAFATASLRKIKNSDEVLKRVKDEIGMDIEILSGETEAKLSFIGAYEYVKDSSHGVLTDIGGGSTEIVLFNHMDIIDSASIDMGSLSVFRDYVKGLFITNKERKKMDKRLKELLDAQNVERKGFDFIHALGGSARATLKLYNFVFDEHPDNLIMRTDDLKSLMKFMLEMENREKMEYILKVKADRIHTLLPGLCILYRVSKYFHAEHISISKTGIREGFVYHRILGRR